MIVLATVIVQFLDMKGQEVWKKYFSLVCLSISGAIRTSSVKSQKVTEKSHSQGRSNGNFSEFTCPKIPIPVLAMQMKKYDTMLLTNIAGRTSYPV